jgi:hypothetical protein
VPYFAKDALTHRRSWYESGKIHEALSVVTTGGCWPNNEGQALKGNVILLSCEDDIADTIRPRLEVLGADLTRIHMLEAIRENNARRSYARKLVTA